MSQEDRKEATSVNKCVKSPAGCGKEIHYTSMSLLERKIYVVTGQCSTCQKEKAHVTC